MTIRVTCDNPLTGKAHSAYSAEAIVESDATYKAYRKEQRAAVEQTILASGMYKAACYRAELMATV